MGGNAELQPVSSSSIIECSDGQGRNTGQTRIASMRCLRCGECCKETEMLISNKDIERLERKGYESTFFVRFDDEGYAYLQNLNGNCVFFDPEKRTCKERANRPLGCRIYPIMFDEEKGIVIDDVCPAKSSITNRQKEKRGKKVIKLLDKIDAEAEKGRIST